MTKQKKVPSKKYSAAYLFDEKHEKILKRPVVEKFKTSPLKKSKIIYSSEEEKIDVSCPETNERSTSDYSSDENNEIKKEASKKVIVAYASNTTERRIWDKVFYCMFCGNAIKGQLPRHLSRHHMNEIQVAEALSYPLKSAKRRKLLGSIANHGNFIHNANVLQDGEGIIIPKKRPSRQRNICDYLPCEHCHAYMCARDLWKHVKACGGKANFLKNKGQRVQARCADLILPCIEVKPQFRAVLRRMKPDKITLAAKHDELIVQYGMKVFEHYGTDSDKVEHISAKIREMGRLLLKLKSKGFTCLRQCLQPKHFDSVVKAVKEVCGYNTVTQCYKTPTLAVKLGYSLKKCARIIKSEAMKTDLKLEESLAHKFEELCNINWAHDVNSKALKTLSDRKLNKESQIPLTEDIVKLHTYIHNEIDRCMEVLKKSFTSTVWSYFCQALLCQVLTFNRRRPGEIGKMKLDSLNKASIGHHSKDIIGESLSPFEQALCSEVYRTQIKGKRGRAVPVLLTKEMKNALDLLVNTRSKTGLKDNPFVFANINSKQLKHYKGSSCLRNFASRCGAEMPALLTATQLRKHLATVSQIINLKECELDVLATFMGHDLRIHREYYRLPSDYLQVAKVSRIMLAMEKGTLHAFSGMTLDELDQKGLKLFKLLSYYYAAWFCFYLCNLLNVLNCTKGILNYFFQCFIATSAPIDFDNEDDSIVEGIELMSHLIILKSIICSHT